MILCLAPRARRGYSLLTVLSLMVLCLSVGIGAASLSTNANRLAHQRLLNAQALQLAVGALEDAGVALRADRNWPGFGSRGLGSGTVSVTITAPASDVRVAEAVGVTSGYTLRSTRRVRGTFLLPAAAPVFLNAIAAKRSLVINGNVSTDSDPTRSQGNVHSNGDLTLDGSAVDIDGRATAVGTVYTSGNPKVSQGMISEHPPLTFPEVDPALRTTALAAGIFSGDQSVSDGRTLRGLVTGNLTIGGTGGARLDGVLWVDGDVSIAGPVTGTGAIVTEGRLELAADHAYPSSDVSQLAFVTLSHGTGGQAAVTLKGNREFKGIVYAPNGEIRVSGTPYLYGNLIGNEITLNGNVAITRWEVGSAPPPPLPSHFVVGGWEEI